MSMSRTPAAAGSWDSGSVTTRPTAKPSPIVSRRSCHLTVALQRVLAVQTRAGLGSPWATEREEATMTGTAATPPGAERGGNPPAQGTGARRTEGGGLAATCRSAATDGG